MPDMGPIREFSKAERLRWCFAASDEECRLELRQKKGKAHVEGGKARPAHTRYSFQRPLQHHRQPVFRRGTRRRRYLCDPEYSHRNQISPGLWFPPEARRQTGVVRSQRNASSLGPHQEAVASHRPPPSTNPRSAAPFPFTHPAPRLPNCPPSNARRHCLCHCLCRILRCALPPRLTTSAATPAVAYWTGSPKRAARVPKSPSVPAIIGFRARFPDQNPQITAAALAARPSFLHHPLFRRPRRWPHIRPSPLPQPPVANLSVAHRTSYLAPSTSHFHAAQPVPGQLHRPSATGACRPAAHLP
ncbi:hypothetical protein EJ02DRAFT_187478 [Clathrospora elynae]|uniref:Uncharacterized protein n=1 Tax=Clathrospora elynae TaxID=706981 RepID=A0A6A5SQ48_9PLEO|nr:hypothetical protein EJ02DRAFT_187478 [Clathrospora elynae]